MILGFIDYIFKNSSTILRSLADVTGNFRNILDYLFRMKL